MDTKRWFTSKTIWVNIIAGAAILIQAFTGEEWLDAEVQAAILAIINLILRIVTKKPLGV